MATLEEIDPLHGLPGWLSAQLQEQASWLDANPGAEDGVYGRTFLRADIEAKQALIRNLTRAETILVATLERGDADPKFHASVVGLQTAVWWIAQPYKANSGWKAAWDSPPA